MASGDPHTKQGDFGRLKADGAATMEELRDFLGHMKGKKPGEVLGLVAESGLTSGILMATAGCFVLLVVCTLVPYWFAGDEVAKKDAAPAASAAQSAASNEVAEVGDAASTPEVPQTATGEQVDEKTLNTLGVGETKTAPANSTPLNSLDNLIDGLDK